MLDRNLGVANVVTLPGCSIKPPGDLITADLARESADGIIDALRDLGIDSDGTIAIHAIDTAISRAAEAAEDAVPGEGADAVIWEQLVRTSYADSTLSGTFVAFLLIATMLAAIAIILDSAVLIVGAMVLGPEFGALAGFAVGLVEHRRHLVRRALVSLAVGFGVAIAVTTLGALLARSVGFIDQSLVDAERPQTGFIITPDKWSLIVALLAGVAGVLSLTSVKSGALVGVFISVTTVPAGGNLALAVALADGHSMAEAALQLGINVTAIVAAAIATLLVQKAIWRRVPAVRSARAKGTRRPQRS